MGWTDEQRAVIEAGTGSLLLSAAAGSGKTTVLVERVLRLVTEQNVDVDRLLVVTFTRAAAADMRAKLTQAMAKRAAECSDPELARRLSDQMLRLERSSITTIHGFCSEFLRTHFEAAGVDPAFRVLDDSLARRLRDDALDQAMEAAYEALRGQEDGAGDPALFALDYGRGPKGVRELTEALMGVLESRPSPADWLKEHTAVTQARIAEWLGEVSGDAKRDIERAWALTREALAVPNISAGDAEGLSKDCVVYKTMLAETECDAIRQALCEFKQACIRKRKGDDEEAAAEVRRLRDAAKDALKNTPLRKFSQAQSVADARALEPQLKRLGELALDAMARFEAAKAEQSGLTYDDLERRTLEALRDEDTAESVREQYEYVFVDEYQDTSAIQEEIVQRVSRPDNRFMVGDVKQSIYRFRQAEPHLFIEKYGRYLRGEGGRVLPMTRNFRSAPTILNFVNMIFSRVMTGGDSEITYDELARLNPGLEPKAEERPVEIHLMENPAGEEGAVDEEIGQMKTAEREALFIARSIRKMRGEGDFKWRDFAILTRSKSSAFTPMLPVLLSEGIPAYAEGAEGYFASMEVGLALSLLQLVSNRRSDLDLLGALHSPVAGLDAEDLARIRLYARDVPFCDAAESYAREGSDALSEKLRSFFAKLGRWRLKNGAVSLGALTREVVEESGLYDYVGALPGGAQRQANLDALVNFAEEFDSDISGSLVRMLRSVDRERSKSSGESARMLGENDDVVRLMTIHHSKGLEFRVVFGALMAKRYGGAKSRPLSSHRKLGLGIDYFDPQLRSRRTTLPQAAIRVREEVEDAAEEMRLLYVLTTRARERLILLGTVRSPETARKTWQTMAGNITSAKSHLDLVMAAREGALAEGGETYSELFIHPLNELSTLAPAAEKPLEQLEKITQSADQADEALVEELLWTYPDQQTARQPLKLTVSGMLRTLEGPDELPELAERPQFMMEESGGMTGAERGTAYHRAMQLMDFEPLRGLDEPALSAEIGRQLDAFAAARRMTPIQREAVREKRLAAFFLRPLGRRLLNAAEVRREWPFNVRLRVSEALTPEEAERYEDQPLLVQGTMDCCFIEDGEWVLLDYKTDRADDVDAVANRYRTQLRVYALALERITRRPVRQRTLVLLGAGLEIDV